MLVRLHSYIREALNKPKSGFIPPGQITEAINKASSDLWRELISDYRKTKTPNDLLNPFKSNGTFNVSANRVLITNKAKAAVSGAEIAVAGARYPVHMFHNDEEWTLRATVQRQSPFLEKRHTYAEGVSSSALPRDFMSHKNVIYLTDGTNQYEGAILPQNEFLDRKNSVLLAPDSENPIATIYNGTIEMLPALTSYESYLLPYVGYTDKKAPFGRYGDAGVDLEIELDEADNGSGNLRVYYYDFPALATATYTQTSGIPSVTVVQELDWNENAFTLLASRAMVYLGATVKDATAVQLEAVVNANQINSINNG